MRANRYSSRNEAGMSLVELMVGMLIGLIGIVIITHLYVTNEQYKRSTTGTGAAQVNGAIALYTLERDVRMAGFGLAHSALLSCTCTTTTPPCSPIQYHYNGTYSHSPALTSTGALAPLRAAPVAINNGLPGVSDQVTIMYTTANERVLSGQLDENMANAGANLKVDGTAGFTSGTGALATNLVIVAQSDKCAMFQLSGVEEATSTLLHVGGSWNPAGGGSLPKFDAGAKVFNLGTPVWRTYSINATANAYQLQLIDTVGLLGGATTQQLVDDIVDMQVQYGKDTSGVPDNVVDVWNPDLPADADQWQRVIAVRIAVLARSGNFEKPTDPGDPCMATTTAPTWSGSGVVDSLGNLSSVLTVPGGLPSCYRYRVFETVIPLRNMIWRAA